MAEAVIGTRRSKGKGRDSENRWPTPRGRTPSRSAMKGARDTGRHGVTGGSKFVVRPERTEEETSDIPDEEQRIHIAQGELNKMIMSKDVSEGKKQKLVELSKSLEGKKSLAEIPKEVKKEVEKEMSNVAISGKSSDDVKSLYSDVDGDISKYCTDKFTTEHPWAKKKYGNPFLEAISKEIEENDDAIVFYTLQVLTGVTTSRRNKSQIFANVNAYIFGTKGSVVDRDVLRDADYFHMAMYLACLTHNVLLPRIESQKGTFDKIKEYGNFNKFGTTRKGLINSRANSLCKRSFKKVEGKIFKQRDLVCQVKDWIEVYLLFPEGALRRACMNIVFERNN